MSNTHRRLFPALTHTQLEALTELCSLRQTATKEALKLYAIDGLTPMQIASATGLAYTNVNRTLNKARHYLELSRRACGLP